MRKCWLNALASVTLAGTLVCVGCGPKSTTVDPGEAQTPEQIQADMEAQEKGLMGDEDPLKDAKPAAEKPADAAPEGGGEAAKE